MSPSEKICVVMPTFNNGGTLHDVVKRVLAYWHTSGAGRLEIACGAGGARLTVPADGIRYVETDLPVDAVKRAYAAAVLLP